MTVVHVRTRRSKVDIRTIIPPAEPAETCKLMTPFPVRLTQELNDRIEAYRHRQPGEALTKSSAMRALMTVGLNTLGKSKRSKKD